MQKARKTLCKVGVRLPKEVPVFITELGRDPLIAWADRHRSHERFNAVVRGPKTWRRLSVIHCESAPHRRFAPFDESLEAFRNSILAVSQGNPPQMAYLDAESRLDIALDWIDNPHKNHVPHPVIYVDYSILAKWGHPRGATQYAKRRREGHTLVILEKRFATAGPFIATHVPYLTFETGLFVQEIDKLASWEPIGGETDYGQKFVVADGHYQDYLGDS